MANRINLIDLYSSYNDIDAGVIETLLDDYNISCSIRTFALSRSSSDVDASVEKRVAVEQDKLEYARKIINNAIKNGVISKEGRFKA